MNKALLKPAEFFLRARERPPRPWQGYLVVFAAYLLSGAANQLATRNLPNPTLLGPSWVWMAIGVVIGSLVLWGLLGFLLHLLTGLGARAFELAGWIFAPGIVTGLGLLVVAALFPVEASLPPPPTDPNQLTPWLRQYQSAVHTSTFAQAGRVLGLLGMLWGAWILYHGTRVLAERKAALVVALYLLVIVVLSLPSLFTK